MSMPVIVPGTITREDAIGEITRLETTLQAKLDLFQPIICA